LCLFLQSLGEIGQLLDLMAINRLEQGFARRKMAVKGADTDSSRSRDGFENGRRINSCLALAVSHDGADVLTIEGVAQGDRLHPVQEAFIAHDGLQCGFCTPGQIMSAIGLIQEGQADDPERVREAMSGNLCRCGAYRGITEAVLEAQALHAASRKEVA
jgi:xanthine dehydrogenase YagT iron-sulfur-binding subunit